MGFIREKTEAEKAKDRGETSVWRGGAQDALRKTAAFLAGKYKLKIEIDPAGVIGSYSKDGTLTIGTRDLWANGHDYYVGLILHEIGHVHTSDFTILEGAGKELRESVNMVEDERVNQILRETYEGAEYYLSEHIGKHITGLETALNLPGPAFATTRTIPELASLFARSIHDEWNNKVSGAGGKEFLPKEDQNMSKYISQRQDEKMRVYRARTVAKAYLLLYGGFLFGVNIGNDECEAIAKQVAALLEEAKTVPITGIVELAKKVERLLSKIAPQPQQEPPPSQAGARGPGSEGVGEKSVMQIVRETMRGGGGHGVSWVYVRTTEPRDVKVFVDADILSQAKARSTAAKLMGKIRENERTRYEGGKLRGRLDKKRIAKAGSIKGGKYRIFSKRILPKGKKYAIATILDTSGSMFSYERDPLTRGLIMPRIKNGWEGTTLIARAFRAMRMPSSITLYGTNAEMVLDHREVYSREVIEARIKRMTSSVYHSGDNETYKAIELALPRLIRSGVGRGKILFIMTDGGLTGRDINISRRLIEDARKKHGVHTVILYVEDTDLDRDCRRILDDNTREYDLQSAREIPEACARLIRSVAGSEVESE